MAANPHIDASARALRDEIEILERNIAAQQCLLAGKAEALKAIESLGLHTPSETAAPTKSAKPAN